MMNIPLSLYQSVLGQEFDTLPRVLKRLHQSSGATLAGNLRVTWSSRWWLRALTRFSGLPRPAQAAPCKAVITPVGGQEHWRRSIGQAIVQSRMMRAGPARIIEQMGLMKLELDTRVDASGRLRQRSRRVTLLGIPLGFIHVVAIERAVTDDRYACDVRIVLSRVGCLLRYDGTLSLCES